MGHLLSAGIRMQDSAPVGATLEYMVTGIIQGDVYIWKNGSTAVLSTSVDVPLTSVSVNAGDTLYMQLAGGSPITTFMYYYVNNSLIATFSGTTTFVTSTYTVSSGNTYKFVYEGFA